MSLTSVKHLETVKEPIRPPAAPAREAGEGLLRPRLVTPTCKGFAA